MIATNQEWVLANWREVRAKDDPAMYATETRHRAPHIWMSLLGNVGWYRAKAIGVTLIHLTWEGYWDDEECNMLKFVSEKQRRLIVSRL